MIRHGEVGDGLEVLRTALDELQETGFVPYFTALLGTLAQGLGEVGQVAEGLATIDEALARSERDEELWCIAELLRLKAELLVRQGRPDAAHAAEEHLQRALDWTRRQGILSMELRCAVGLAQSWQGRGRTGAARELLGPVYARFTEGFGTAELQTAKRVLDDLG
jgi:predicted ATPase